ncbi:MAG: diguanylate cyclase [Ilumatobacteraceae bacterium]
MTGTGPVDHVGSTSPEHTSADPHTAERMLRTLVPMATAFGGLLVVSTLAGFGTYGGITWPVVYFVVLAICQVWWRWASSAIRRSFSLVLLAVLVVQYTVGYLVLPPQEALVAILNTLLFMPLLLAVVAMSEFSFAQHLIVFLAVLLAGVSVVGANRPELEADGFDWRFGPLFGLTTLLLAYYLQIWVGHRRDLAVESMTRQSLEVDLELSRLDADTDELTGLRNRRSGLRLLDDLARSETAFSVLVIDVDHFKRVNDTLGHDGGDVVLRSVAAVLSRLVRGDDAVCRWGGEEFVAVVVAVGPEPGRLMAERLRAAVRAEVTAGDTTVTVSVGVAHRGAGESAMNAMKQADGALYEAKAAGRDRVVVADTNS